MCKRNRSAEGELTCICADPKDLNCIIPETILLQYDDAG